MIRSARVLTLLLAWLAVLATTAWVYWPALEGPQLLDDFSNLHVFERVEENAGLAVDEITGNRSGPLGRPVSMLSFAVEAVVFGSDPTTSKLINLALHLLNGNLLALLSYLVLSRAGMPSAALPSLLVAAAWLLSPLYVSTVMYSVQRMAILATLFMLCSAICYIAWRIDSTRLLRGKLCLLGVPAFILLAVLSKENGLVIVPILLLIELLMFEFKKTDGTVSKTARASVLGLTVTGAIGVVTYLAVSMPRFERSFEHRGFTLLERLLTESRIVWDYVRQLLSPDLSRMGLYHDDYVVSSALTSPPATWISLLAWGVVLIVACLCLRWKWGRVAAIAMAIFLIGHSLESTVFPLELYFEHRNYFPGAGIFLLFAVGFGCITQRWPQLRNPLLAWSCLAVVLLATGTSSQARVWSSLPLIRFAHLNGHPESFRANIDYAHQLASSGELGLALEYSGKAHALSADKRADMGEGEGDYHARNVALACIANQPLSTVQLTLIGTENPSRPLSSVSTMQVLLDLLQSAACPGFNWDELADHLAGLYFGPATTATASSGMYAVLAAMENALGRYAQAYAYIDRALILQPGVASRMLMKLHFSLATGKTEEAEAIKMALLKMQASGDLTVSEQQNLALYLE